MGDSSLRGKYHVRKPLKVRTSRKIRFFFVRTHGRTQLPKKHVFRVARFWSRPLTNIQSLSTRSAKRERCHALTTPEGSPVAPTRLFSGCIDRADRHDLAQHHFSSCERVAKPAPSALMSWHKRARARRSCACFRCRKAPEVLLKWRIRRACSPLDAWGAWQRSRFAERVERL